jgi:hypothetical protein
MALNNDSVCGFLTQQDLPRRGSLSSHNVTRSPVAIRLLRIQLSDRDCTLRLLVPALLIRDDAFGRALPPRVSRLLVAVLPAAVQALPLPNGDGTSPVAARKLGQTQSRRVFLGGFSFNAYHLEPVNRFARSYCAIEIARLCVK